jgi:hypothetical protein
VKCPRMTTFWQRRRRRKKDPEFLRRRQTTMSWYSTTNKAFFASILNDLNSATAPEHFIYFCGWWTDVDIPLGDPKAEPTPPTLRATLSALAKGTPAAAGPMTPTRPPPGPEVCCMEWKQKLQSDLPLLASFPAWLQLPVSIYGAPYLATINCDSTKFVNYLGPGNKGILDTATRIFGSHHQKYIVIRNESGLVAYAGSSDFNADRLYATGDQSAAHPPTDRGAPLHLCAGESFLWHQSGQQSITLTYTSSDAPESTQPGR